MKVRKVKREDTDGVVALAQEMFALSSFRNMDFSPGKFEKIVDFASDEDSAYFLGVCDIGGDIEGFLLGSCTPSFFGEDKVGVEMCFYMRPDIRSYHDAKRMVDLFEKFCADRGAKRITIGSSAEIVDRRYMKFLTRLGYREAGFIAIK